MSDDMNIERLAEMSESQQAVLPAASNTKKKLIAGLVGGGLVVACSAFAWASIGGESQSSPAASASTGADAVLATVNGAQVTELEVAGLLQAGVDRAIVVDRYINKVLAAEQAKRIYADEAEASLRAAEREVLSTLYTTKRLDELRKAIKEDEIKKYYDDNVLDENFKLWKVSYYLSMDQNDVQKTLESLKKGDKEAIEQLKPLVDTPDGFAVAATLPYNLGRVVSQMKKGEYSEILRLRNGLLVLKIEDTKQVEKPTLESLKEDIIQTLATQKFNAELDTARKSAKVQLG